MLVQLVDIFRKKFLFLPIHDGVHWSLVIIYIDDSGNVLIMHLNSLKGKQAFLLAARPPCGVGRRRKAKP